MFLIMPTTEIYTLSLHDALPIYATLFFRLDIPYTDTWIVTGGDEPRAVGREGERDEMALVSWNGVERAIDRKSTRLNSSHRCISYAVFCLKKKKKKSSRTALGLQ